MLQTLRNRSLKSTAILSISLFLLLLLNTMLGGLPQKAEARIGLMPTMTPRPSPSISPTMTPTPTPSPTPTPTPTPSPTPTPGNTLFGVQLLSNEPTFFSTDPEIIRTRVIFEVDDGDVAGVDWAWGDAAVNEASQMGEVLLEFWVRDPDDSPEGDCSTLTPAIYADFVEALADRYENDLWGIELDNEPDRCGQTPEEYAERLNSGVPEIEAEAPNAEIIMGGLAFEGAADEQWFEDMLSELDNLNCGVPCTDHFGLHFYDDMRGRWGGAMENKIDQMLSYAALYGASGTPVSMTEVGDDAFEYWLPPARRENEQQMAAGVEAVLQECQDYGTPVCIVYRAQEQQANPPQSFGLWRYDGSTRPAWAVFLNFVP